MNKGQEASPPETEGQPPTVTGSAEDRITQNLTKRKPFEPEATGHSAVFFGGKEYVLTGFKSYGYNETMRRYRTKGEQIYEDRFRIWTGNYDS